MQGNWLKPLGQLFSLPIPKYHWFKNALGKICQYLQKVSPISKYSPGVSGMSCAASSSAYSFLHSILNTCSIQCKHDKLLPGKYQVLEVSFGSKSKKLK